MTMRELRAALTRPMDDTIWFTDWRAWVVVVAIVGIVEAWL